MTFLLGALMPSLVFTIKQAFRSLQRAPGFTLTALLTLALGIGATTAMFATLHAALWKPLPFKDPQSLVLPRTTFSGQENDTNSSPDFFDYREKSGIFEYLSVLAGPIQMSVILDRPERLTLTLVSPDFFQMLGVQPVAGRWPSTEEGLPGGPAVVVVSEGYAWRRFGGPREALGRTLVVSQPTPVSYDIVGVAPATLDVLSVTHVWLPGRKGDPIMGGGRGSHGLPLVGRLKPGVSLRTAQLQADAFARQLEATYPDTNKDKGMRLNPLQDALMESSKPQLFLLAGSVTFLLLIACGNVAGLMLARGTSRRAELAVRASMGATRGRLVRQLLGESLLLSLLAGLLGLLLARFLVQVLPAVSGLENRGVPAGRLDPPVLAFSLGVSLLTGLLFGIVPALRAASKNLAEDLASSRRPETGRPWLRNGLVVAQVALSLVLLVGSGLLLRSLVNFHHAPMGFDTRQLLIGEIQFSHPKYQDIEQGSRFLEELQAQLRAVPGVKAAGFMSHIPLRHGSDNSGVWTPDHPPADSGAGGVETNRYFVHPGCFEAMGIPLLAGRDVSLSDGPRTAKVAVISERTARTLFSDRSPLGQTLLTSRDGELLSYEVVGVVGNARVEALSVEARPAMYLPFRQTPPGMLQLRMCPMIRTSLDSAVLLLTLRGLISAKDPDIPIDPLLSMDERIRTRLAPRRVTATTLVLFSTVALILASLGLFGVLSYMVGQRTREIGLRSALGARTSQVVWEIVRHGLILAAFGIGIGVLAALGTGRILASQLYKVSAADPVSMALGSLILCLVALLASFLPALQAARVDPMVALRDE